MQPYQNARGTLANKPKIPLTLLIMNGHSGIKVAPRDWARDSPIFWGGNESGRTAQSWEKDLRFPVAGKVDRPQKRPVPQKIFIPMDLNLKTENFLLSNSG